MSLIPAHPSPPQHLPLHRKLRLLQHLLLQFSLVPYLPPQPLPALQRSEPTSPAAARASIQAGGVHIHYMKEIKGRSWYGRWAWMECRTGGAAWWRPLCHRLQDNSGCFGKSVERMSRLECLHQAHGFIQRQHVVPGKRLYFCVRKCSILR